MQPDPSETDGR